MRPLVFDGVGTVSVYQSDGTLKYLDDKISKVSLQLQLDWQKVMGGESGYAFHYTAQYLADKASIEIPRFSTILAELSQGAETERGSVKFDETETGVLDPTNGYTVKAPTKYGGTFVAATDKVFLKDAETGELVPAFKLQGQALEYAAKGAILLRDSSDFDYTESIRSADVMVKTFGGDVDTAFSLFAQGAAKGINGAEDMLDSITEFSPAFKTIGYDAEGMLGVFANGMGAGVGNTVLKVKDIQAILKIGRNQAYNLVESRAFHSVKIGRTILIPKSDFITWMEGNDSNLRSK